MVIPAIAQYLVGSVARPARFPSHGQDGVEQWQELGNVIAVSASERDGEWGAMRVGQEVMFGS
jgi:hypothetical protein